MPNTAIHRAENCCMPPKKSAWRFENTKLIEHSKSESQFAESDRIYYNNMGIMYDENKMKPVYPIQCYASVEAFPHAKHVQSVDAPLDFSLKKCDNPQIRTDRVNHLMIQEEKHDLRKDNNMKNNLPTQMFTAPHILNGNNSPPSPPNNNSPALLDNSHVSSSCKDSDSLDMDCSQESAKSPPLPVNSSANRMNEIIRVDSPEQKRSISRTPSRENSPAGQSSILAEMLKGQQQSNFALPNRSQTFGPGYAPGFGVYEGQIVTSPSPPMAVSTPIMHPASILPLTAVAQYLGYGYVEPSHPFMQNYMYKPPEPSILDVPTSRKPKRKTDPFTDSLKTCSVEELQKKLDSLSGGSLVSTNSNYAINSSQTHTPQADNCRRLSNNTSLVPVKNTLNNDVKICSTINSRENSQVDNSVNSQNEISGKGNTEINQNQENSIITSDAETNNSQNMDNTNQMNGANNIVANISCTDVTNDSQPSAISESPFGRKKSVPDYKDDPNYRLKRAKNNMAARRSREHRRIKEEIIRKTAVVLEQKNIILTRENTALKSMFDEAKMKYYTLMKEYENMKIQNSVLSERLNQKRCGQCGSTLPSVN